VDCRPVSGIPYIFIVLILSPHRSNYSPAQGIPAMGKNFAQSRNDYGLDILIWMDFLHTLHC
jgi:hypothetical protein